MNKIQVTVNHNKCVGSRLCLQFMPEVFMLNEHGQSVAANSAGPDLTKLVQVAEQCPQCAITITNSETGEIYFPPIELQ